MVGRCLESMRCHVGAPERIVRFVRLFVQVWRELGNTRVTLVVVKVVDKLAVMPALLLVDDLRLRHLGKVRMEDDLG